ncbi:cytochrome P450 9e2-like [Tribolium madens]|uniref:cytochrome P450 9e2-like n=1 Tax=Tribolium madens TaxID=41895 RepID=UPI001CF73305|nr:cytochrome P450 9e2-like [Tribolium madens]
MILLVVLGVLISCIWAYYKIIKPVKYWQERDVIHAKAWPIVGSLKDVTLKKKHVADAINEIYNQFPNERCVGYMDFTKPFLMIRDLELIKRITVKDFDHFQDHLAFDTIISDPLLAKSLLSLNGESWKRMRATISPVFTSSKMRFLYTLMEECAENFTNYFKEKEVKVEMKELFSKFANDVIASTAFGIQIDSLKDPNNEFFKMGSSFTNFELWSILKIFIMQLAPGLANLLRLRVFSEEITNFFRSLVRDNIEKRHTEGIIRPDLIHLLMQAQKGQLKSETDEEIEHSVLGNAKIELTDDHFVSQALTFFLAGFDTVSTAASFMAQELALNPQVQKQLQLEIDSVWEKYNGKVPYETLQSMKYLDQVVCETLRLWPPASQTDRLCVKSYVIEPVNPKEKVVFVEKGTSVLVPIMSIQRDPNYWENPDKFDPERFSDENRTKIIPGAYLPFGAGPRNCIGSRFALLEIKILFFHLLSKFILVPGDNTEITLKLDPTKLSMTPEHGFQLSLKRRLLSP